MLNTPEALQPLIASSPWPDTQFTSLALPDSAAVFALSVKTEEAEAMWQWWRERLSETGRWPLLNIGWGGMGASWEARVQDAQLLSRWSYEHEAWRQPGDDLTPSGLIQAALQKNPLSVFERLREDYPLDEDLSVTDTALYGNPGTAYLDWFQPSGHELQVLLLLPTPHGWSAPAWLHWFGAERCQSEAVISVLRAWEQTHGAELVAHYGTMLQCQLPGPLTDLTTARQVAEEHELLAPCTLMLPGVSRAEHAQALLQVRRWFLHERP